MLWLMICHECEVTTLYVVFSECDSFRGVSNCRCSLMSNDQANCVGLIECGLSLVSRVNYVFVIVFCVYSCLLWLFSMSANIQFMETVNLLSRIREICRNFLAHPILWRVQVFASGQFIAGQVCTCNLRSQ